jgi:hypothetical protein
MEDQLIGHLIQVLSSKYPFLLQLVVVMGIVRLVMKPVFTLAASLLALYPTSDKKDKINALMNSKAWRLFTFLVDYTFSIKIPFAPGSVGFKVQQAVIADKGVDPTPEPPKPAAGL